MRKLALLFVVLFVAGQGVLTASPHKTKKKHHKPKNEITKIRKARKEDHTTRQVTVDPKKSPGKHASNLSKNVNHEANRESKDINKFFQGKKK